MSAARSPLRPFVLTAMFWLPAMFLLWFLLSSPVAYPVVRLLDALFSAWMPELVRDIHQEFHQLVFAYEVTVQVPGMGQATLMIEEQRANVLIYAYGLPLFLGLVMATPMSWARTFAQWMVGLLVLTLAESFGMAGKLLFTIAFGAGPAVTAGLAEQGIAGAAAAGTSAAAHVQAVLAGHGLSLDLVALFYQFGYLVVPAVVPVVLWIALNRRFLETLVGWRQEPQAASGGPSSAMPPAAAAGPPPTPEEGSSR